MDVLFLLLLGGAVFLWFRLDRLEQRVARLTEQLDETRHAYFTNPPVAQAPETDALPPDAPQQYDVAEPVAAAPIEEPVTATPVEEPQGEEIDAAPEPAEEPVAAERAYADESAPDEVLTEEPRKGFTFDFEDIFGRRLPIWGGGFALAIAGIFLVRFSIEAGLLTPLVRVALSFVFGLALLAAAEAAFRFEERLHDPRVRQSLAGAGLATLYGAFYLAGTAYGLIGAGAAFIGLATVTAAAIALSFRFGLPSAIIGLVGGFAAPLLVDSDSSNVPLLSFYLALITGGLAWTGHAQGRNWLGYAALAAGLGWGVLMMFAGVSSDADFAALGLYLVVLGTVLPAFLHSKGGPSIPKLAAGAIATLQMAVLVSDAGFAPLTWGLYLLIGAALSALGWRYPALRLGTLVAAGLGLWLLIMWPQPDEQFFALVAAAQVAIFAGVPLAYQWLGRARLLDIAQLSAVTFIMGIVIYVRFGSWGDLNTEPMLAASMAGLALLPAVAFALMWRREEQGETRRSLALLIPATLLSFVALLLLTPAWIAPVMAMLVGAPLLWLYWRRDALALHISAWASAAMTVLTLMVTPDFLTELTQLGDTPESVDMARAALRWLATTAPFAFIALIARDAISRGVGEAVGVALAYGVIAQVVPSLPLAWIAALATIAFFILQPNRIAAWGAAIGIAGMWAFIPLATWGVAGAFALLGEPFLADKVVTPGDLAVRVAPFAAALGVALWQGQDHRIEFRAAITLILGIIAGIALHSLYKQAFGITSLLRFEQYGMGERTIWQAALLLAAYGVRTAMPEAVPQEVRRWVCLGLVAASLLHFVWFTLMMHNPLLTVQHVGPTPIANWLTLAYCTAIGGIWLAMSEWEEAPAPARYVANAATMGLISLLAYSLLRQIFAGSILTSRAIEQTESLLISLLGIVLALGFLWWGSWRKERSWRIGSLVLMLAAVIKVFLIDAAGLEGLLRIASFMALGFSLIGIGWVYTRQLSQRSAEAA